MTDDSFLPGNGMTRLRPSEAALPAGIGEIPTDLTDDSGNRRLLRDLSGAEICRFGQRVGVPVSADNGRETNARAIAAHINGGVQ